MGSSVTGLTYDVENRVIGISYPGGTTNSFAYNGEDLRVSKVDSTGTQNYVTDGSSPASAVLKDGNAVYTPGVSERRGGASKFYHGDALGSTRGITDSTQAPTDSILYDAFGNTVSRTGTTPTPFGFVGKEQYQSDCDSGLQLLGHRYYDPSIGRFLSQDPIQDGTNWYAYCDNNSLNKTDGNGLQAVKRTGKPIKKDPGLNFGDTGPLYPPIYGSPHDHYGLIPPIIGGKHLEPYPILLPIGKTYKPIEGQKPSFTEQIWYGEYPIYVILIPKPDPKSGGIQYIGGGIYESPKPTRTAFAFPNAMLGCFH